MLKLVVRRPSTHASIVVSSVSRGASTWLWSSRLALHHLHPLYLPHLRRKPQPSSVGSQPPPWPWNPMASGAMQWRRGGDPSIHVLFSLFWFTLWYVLLLRRCVYDCFPSELSDEAHCLEQTRLDGGQPLWVTGAACMRGLEDPRQTSSRAPFAWLLAGFFSSDLAHTCLDFTPLYDFACIAWFFGCFGFRLHPLGW